MSKVHVRRVIASLHRHQQVAWLDDWKKKRKNCWEKNKKTTLQYRAVDSFSRAAADTQDTWRDGEKKKESRRRSIKVGGDYCTVLYCI